MSGVHWVTEPNAYLEPKIGKSGYAAKAPKTVIQAFQETVSKHGSQNAMAAKLKVNVSRINVVYYVQCFCLNSWYIWHNFAGNSFEGLEVLDLPAVLG